MKIYFIILSALLLTGNLIASEDYVVATNLENKTEVQIRPHYLQKSGFDHWDNGNEIFTLDTKDKNPAKKIFVEKVLKMNMGHYLNYWAQERAKGRSISVLILSTNEEVLRFLKSEKGAIGYLPKKMAIGVRVLETFSVE